MAREIWTDWISGKSEGANLNARDGNGRTPLHVAAFQGQGPATRVRIDAGADLALRDDERALKALLAAGASAQLTTSVYHGTVLTGDLNVPAHRLSQWRDRVLHGGMSALKEQEGDARDDEIARLKAKIDELEAGRPLARRSRGHEPLDLHLQTSAAVAF